MSNIVELVSFNLKKGVSIPDFLLVSDKFNRDFMSVQKGYISRKLLRKGNNMDRPGFVGKLGRCTKCRQNHIRKRSSDGVYCFY